MDNGFSEYWNEWQLSAPTPPPLALMMTTPASHKASKTERRPRLSYGKSCHTCNIYQAQRYSRGAGSSRVFYRSFQCVASRAVQMTFSCGNSCRNFIPDLSKAHLKVHWKSSLLACSLVLTKRRLKLSFKNTGIPALSQASTISITHSILHIVLGLTGVWQPMINH